MSRNIFLLDNNIIHMFTVYHISPGNKLLIQVWNEEVRRVYQKHQSSCQLHCVYFRDYNMYTYVINIYRGQQKTIYIFNPSIQKSCHTDNQFFFYICHYVMGRKSMIKLLFGSKYYPQAFFKKFVKEKNTKSFVKQVFEKLKSDDLFVSREKRDSS